MNFFFGFMGIITNRLSSDSSEIFFNLFVKFWTSLSPIESIPLPFMLFPDVVVNLCCQVFLLSLRDLVNLCEILLFHCSQLFTQV
jgi:hypothetical protein